MEALDTLLWTYTEESFLPHGTKRDGNAAEQPVFLTTEETNPNGANVRFLVDGAGIAEHAGYERIVYMFDGHDSAAVATRASSGKRPRPPVARSPTGSSRRKGAGKRRHSCQPGDGAGPSHRTAA